MKENWFLIKTNDVIHMKVKVVEKPKLWESAHPIVCYGSNKYLSCTSKWMVLLRQPNFNSKHFLEIKDDMYNDLAVGKKCFPLRTHIVMDGNYKLAAGVKVPQGSPVHEDVFTKQSFEKIVSHFNINGGKKEFLITDTKY